ncbi:MFS transporter, partial [Thermodesulfobacteriota bacterium]
LSYFTLAYSWRAASVVSGCIILALCLPLAGLMHRSPEERGLEPDGGPGKVENAEQDGPREATVDEVDFTIKQALKTFTFWLLTLCISLRILVTVAISAHMIPILVWKGMDEAAAAYMVSLYAFLTIIGMLVVGWIGDRFKKSMLCCVCLLITAVCLMWQTVSSTGTTLYLLPVGMAIAMGSVPLNWSLIGDFFGRRSYARLRGIMLISVGITTFISPVYAGWIFDRTESYTVVLISFSGMLLIPAVLFAILRPPAPAKLEK